MINKQRIIIAYILNFIKLSQKKKVSESAKVLLSPHLLKQVKDSLFPKPIRNRKDMDHVTF